MIWDTNDPKALIVDHEGNVAGVEGKPIPQVARQTWGEREIARHQLEMPDPTPQTTVEEAAEILRAAGWIVAPPTPEKLPEPTAGQVWVSTKPRVEPRTVIKVGPGRSWMPDVECVHFKAPSDTDPRPRYLPRKSWDAWVKKSGARPQ